MTELFVTQRATGTLNVADCLVPIVRELRLLTMRLCQRVTHNPAPFRVPVKDRVFVTCLFLECDGMPANSDLIPAIPHGTDRMLQSY